MVMGVRPSATRLRHDHDNNHGIWHVSSFRLFVFSGVKREREEICLKSIQSNNFPLKEAGKLRPLILSLSSS